MYPIFFWHTYNLSNTLLLHVCLINYTCIYSYAHIPLSRYFLFLPYYCMLVYTTALHYTCISPMPHQYILYSCICYIICRHAYTNIIAFRLYIRSCTVITCMSSTYTYKLHIHVRCTA